MKRTSLLILLTILTATSLLAQNIGYSIGDRRSAYNIKIDDIFMVISEHGKIVAIKNEPQYVGKDSDGRVAQIGDLQITYYSDFNSYESGKVKTIGDVKFTYYSNFNSYEAGKIKSIGDKRVTYYSNFNSYEAGKIKSIGGVRFTYYSDFNSYESGKIKSIGAQIYSYHSSFGPSEGALKSGSRTFTQDGVTFNIH